MKILQSVVVKQVVTEKSKRELLDKFVRNIVQLQKEIAQLQFEQKRMEKNKRNSGIDVQQHYEAEIQKRNEKMKLVSFQIDQLKLLPIGSELKEREVQAIIDYQVGDKWDIKTQAEIVIKDGIVHEIR